MPRKASAPAVPTDDSDLRAEINALKARNAELEDALESAIEAPGIVEIEKRSPMSGSVTVACKIPQGLKLQLQHAMKRRMPLGRGGHDDYEVIDVMVFGGPAYHVFGPSMPAMIPDGYIIPKAMEGGYALTPGIPADFWRTWLEQNKMADYVTNSMIFAYDAASTKSAARERKDLKSGMEPLSRELDKNGMLTDRRVPKPLNGSVARIGFDADRSTERGDAASA